MKNLKQFMPFNFNGFSAGKTFVVTGIKSLIDYNTKVIIGTKVECAITKDETVYEPDKNGNISTNLYEKLTVKVRLPNTVNVNVGDTVTFRNATANVYGDYSNLLSVEAEAIDVVKATKGAN